MLDGSRVPYQPRSPRDMQAHHPVRVIHVLYERQGRRSVPYLTQPLGGLGPDIALRIIKRRSEGPDGLRLVHLAEYVYRRRPYLPGGIPELVQEVLYGGPAESDERGFDYP